MLELGVVVVVVVIVQGLGSSPLLLGKRLGMVMTAVLVALKKAGSRGLSLLSGKAVAGGKPLSLSSDKAGVEKKIRDNELKNKKSILASAGALVPIRCG